MADEGCVAYVYTLGLRMCCVQKKNIEIKYTRRTCAYGACRIAHERCCTYAVVCWCMLTYACVCLRMLTYAYVCLRMLTYADAGRVRTVLAVSLTNAAAKDRAARGFAIDVSTDMLRWL